MRRRAVLAFLALLAGLVPFLGTAQADPPTHLTGYIPVSVGTLDEAQLHYKLMLPDVARFGGGPYPTTASLRSAPLQLLADELDATPACLPGDRRPLTYRVTAA